MKPITIVGGGLAGLTLGIALRRRDVPVTVYEAGHYPRHRVCGEFISGDGRRILAQLGLEQKLLKAGATLATTAAFYSGTKHMRHNVPEPALCISRYELDTFLANEFQKSGGNLETNHRWKADFSDGVVRATGRRIRPAKSGPRWFGLKVHAKNVSAEADLEMHIVPNGYVGICKLPANEVNICGLFRSEIAVPDLARIWKHWFRGPENSAIYARLQHASFNDESFCATAALSLQPQHAAEHDECCIGDAITMIAPATGNGMSMAFESSAIATEPLTQYSEGRLNWSAAKNNIASALDQKFARRLKWSSRLQFLLMSQPRCAITLGKFSPLWRLFFHATR